MMYMTKVFVEVGAGPGLGNAVARKFAAQGFKVVLLSRNENHLAAYQRAFRRDGYDADIRTIDMACPDAAQAILQKIKADYPRIDTIHYNVGITEPDAGKTLDAAAMANRYQVDVLSFYQVLQVFADDDFAAKGGTILVTGGGLALRPLREFLPLSMDKAALRALVLAVHDAWKNKGLYIASLQVTNAIGLSPGYEPDTLADMFWDMYLRRSGPERVY